MTCIHCLINGNNVEIEKCDKEVGSGPCQNCKSKGTACILKRKRTDDTRDVESLTNALDETGETQDKHSGRNYKTLAETLDTEANIMGDFSYRQKCVYKRYRRQINAWIERPLHYTEIFTQDFKREPTTNNERYGLLESVCH